MPVTPRPQVAVGDPPVELGDGDLQGVHRLVERGAVGARRRRLAQHGVDVVDRVERARRDRAARRAPGGSRAAAPARPAGSGRARAGSARPTALDRPAHGPLVHLQPRHATAARPSTAPRRGRASPPSPSRPAVGADSTAAARTPSTRVVMSARSSARPSRHITYASSWVIAVASTPSRRRLSAMTRPRKRSRTRRSTPRSASVVDVEVQVVERLPAVARASCRASCAGSRGPPRRS